jgi:cytochrome b subunit of formate dehydrogenase
MATATSRAEETLERFNDVQVYVHGVLALSIFALYLTGLPMTFNQSLGWLFDVFGRSNVVIGHVVSGVVMIASMLYLTVYMVLGLIVRETTLMNVLPRLDDIREGIQQMKWLAGMGSEPASHKYSVLQKAEIWIIAVEVGVMAVTGLLLYYVGVLSTASPNPLMLIFRDVHAIIAVTMLMGIVFHLFMTHIAEYPLDRSMFDGKVDLGRACDEWQAWAESETGVGDAPCEEHTHSTILTGGMVIGFLLFMIIFTGVLLQYVLAPLPTGGPSLISTVTPNTLPTGVIGLIYDVGLNLAVLVILASIGALLYGFALRWGVAE